MIDPACFTASARALADEGNWNALKALTAIATNLEKRPFDERVRTLRRSNESVQRNLLDFDAARAFLGALGFVEVEGFLSLTGVDAAVTARGALAALSAVAPMVATEGNPPASAPTTPWGDSVRGRESLRSAVLKPPRGLRRVVAPSTTWQDLDAETTRDARRQLQGANPPFGQAILLFGPPGSGKTAVAHASAEAWGLRVVTVWGGELFTPFAKTHTAQLRHFTRHAAEVSPCVLLLLGVGPLLPRVVADLLASVPALPGVVVAATCPVGLVGGIVGGIGDEGRDLPSAHAAPPRPTRRRSGSCGAGTGAGAPLDCLDVFDILVHVGVPPPAPAAPAAREPRERGVNQRVREEDEASGQGCVAAAHDRAVGAYRAKTGRLAGLPVRAGHVAAR